MLNSLQFRVFGQALIVSALFIYSTVAVAIASTSDLSKGVELYNAGKYSQSLPLLEAAVRANPYDDSSHYYLGLCYQSLKQITLAKSHFQWVATNARNATVRSYAAKAMAAYSAPTTASNSNASEAQPAKQTSQQMVVQAADTKIKQLGRCKVLMFETSWCHYCHEFAPQFDEAAQNYRSVDFQHVDAEDPANLEMKQKYGIKSYPRLVYLDGKGNVLYNEGRGEFSNRLHELTGR
jgi:thiol-disulfide isomerase/thioredoxin